MDVIVIVTLFFSLITGILWIGKVKDIFNPLVIFCFPLFLQYTFYFILYKNEDEISIDTQIILLYAITSFIIGVCISYCGAKKKAIGHYSKINFNREIFCFLCVFSILGLLLGLFEMYQFGMSRENVSFYTNVRFNVNYGKGYNPITIYGSLISKVLSCILLYNLQFTKQKKVTFFFCAMSGVYCIIGTARTDILMTFFAFLYLLENNFRKEIFGNKKGFVKFLKRFLIGSIIMLWIFIVIAELTGKLGSEKILDPDFFVFKYLGYPIPTFDRYILSNPSVSEGFFSLGIFGKILAEINILEQKDYSSILPDNTVFNVYTFLGVPYLDGGIIGVLVCSLFLGIISGIIYKFSNLYGNVYTIFYALFSYAIIMSFYAYQFNLTTYIYIIIILFMIKLTARLKIFTRYNIERCYLGEKNE